MNRVWWKEKIIYQIYPRSFCDSNGDGVGDIRGIINKLDYLEYLGVDIIWLCPICLSPMVDNGYDVSDYTQIDPLFGSNEDLEELIRKAGEKNIYIMMDLVFNHCSIEHEWFKKAAAEPGSEEAGYFYILDEDDERSRNNWRSVFGGSTWSSLPDGRRYFHTFAKEQPDLNWENPRLRQRLYDIVKWWIQKGIKGFRVDAITYIKKDTTFSNRYPTARENLFMVENMQNYPGIGEFLSEFCEKCFRDNEVVTVAEAPGVRAEDVKKYSGETGYFSMIFEFSYADMNKLDPGWSVAKFRENIFHSQKVIQDHGWYGTFLENHDGSRCGNKYICDDDLDTFGDIPKKMLAVLYFCLKGTPFIYQGQEIGMNNRVFRTGEGNCQDEIDDISTKGLIEELLKQGRPLKEALKEATAKSRDNGRMPMPWNEKENAGFTDGIPWMRLNDDFHVRNVEEMSKDKDSILNFYRRLISLRKESEWKDILNYGDFVPLERQNETTIAYERGLGEKKLLIICNCSASIEKEIPEGYGNILLSNYPGEKEDKNILRPYEAVMMFQ